jgi:hypothetical protein
MAPFGKKRTIAYKKGPFTMKGYTYPGTAPTKNKTKYSERAEEDEASKETVQRLRNIEAGEDKLSTLTDPEQIARVKAKLRELQPNKEV